MTDEEKRRLIAYHETGHALVGWALPMADPVHKITIVARGRSLGHTLALPTHDKYLVRRSELVDQLAMLLGGRTAEELIFSDPTSGAANDIEKATQIARRMVMEFGMSDKLGPMQYGRAASEVFLGRDYGRQQDYSDEVAAFIDEEVRTMINAAHEEARVILDAHSDAMERMVAILLDKETVGTDEVAQIFSDVPKWEHDPDGSLRIRPPSQPPHAEPGLAAAVTVDEDAVSERQGDRVASPESCHASSRPTPLAPDSRPGSQMDQVGGDQVDLPAIEEAVRNILIAIGEDPEREGLRETPQRVARMYAEIFDGIGRDPGDVVDAFFGDEHYQEIVMVRDIPFYSSCEHHLVPFHGKAHVAYIPQGRVTGLSKLARLIEGFARRPQMQERLTAQVADTLMDRLDPLGVMVVIEAEHLCMSMRGVRKPGSITVTSAVRGAWPPTLRPGPRRSPS